MFVLFAVVSYVASWYTLPHKVRVGISLDICQATTQASVLRTTDNYGEPTVLDKQTYHGICQATTQVSVLQTTGNYGEPTVLDKHTMVSVTQTIQVSVLRSTDNYDEPTVLDKHTMVSVGYIDVLLLIINY